MSLISNVIKTVIITVLVTVIATFVILGISPFGTLMALVVLILGFGELAILYLMKRKVLYRKQNIFAKISIGLLGATFIVAILDYKIGASALPSWTSVLGMLLFFSGNYLLISALFSLPRHGKEEYNEDDKPEKNMLSIHGPYDVIRHPINLAGFLFSFSIPLILGSAFAFIAAAVAAIFIIVHAVKIENYRFENYTWYFDYTKRVPYMMMPVIW